MILSRLIKFSPTLSLVFLLVSLTCHVQIIWSEELFTEVAVPSELPISMINEKTSSGVNAKASGIARIVFAETTYDFVRVKQGEKVTKRFGFKNEGNGDLIIRELKTSCGCTAAVTSTGPYRPTETGTINLSYDTRGKFGYTSKSVQVFSNDPNSPQTLTMEGVVIGETHPTKTVADVLFSGSCATCHSTPAKSKEGEELYNSVCYLCHDFPRESGKNWIAPAKNSLSRLSKRRLKKVISKGIPNSSMPGFSYHAGGPLSEEQIDSLVQYIDSISQDK